MTYPLLHFLNLAYWYCIVISLFGAHCTSAELAATGAPAAPSSATGFWSWLFGAAFAPGNPLGAAFAAIGTVLAFLWAIFSFFALALSLVLLAIIAASAVGLFLVRIGDHERYGTLPPAASRAHPLHARWQELLDDAMSSDPKRWRRALLGADEMLGELFARLGYAGATTAERIAAVPEGAFANLPAAWEAHRVKNLVAAPSSRFVLTQREAFRVLKLYEQALREFDIV